MKTKVIAVSICLMFFSACHHSKPPQEVTKLFAQSQKAVPAWATRDYQKIDFIERGKNGDVENVEVSNRFKKMNYSILWYPYDYIENYFSGGSGGVSGRHGTPENITVKSVPKETWTALQTGARRNACGQARSIMRYYANNTLHIKHPKFIQKIFWQEYVTTFGGKTKITEATLNESCYVTLKKEVVKDACTKNQGANQKNKNCLPGIGKKSGGMGPAKIKAPGTEA